MQRTSIEWTGTYLPDGALAPGFTANPLKYRDAAGNVVWGCVHASPGCVHCYAETLAKRYGRGGPFNHQTMAGLTPFLAEDELRKMLTARVIQGEPVSGRRCFVGDMTDVFGEWVWDDLLDRLFAVFLLRPDVTWQVLTKRAKRMREYFHGEGVARRIAEHAKDLYMKYTPGDLVNRLEHVKMYPVGPMTPTGPEFGMRWFVWPWPIPNVWLGVSCEDQQRADDRIPHLIATPAAIRFISAEPLLGPINLREFGHHDDWHVDALDPPDQSCRVHWVIPGGESGAGARDCQTNWIRDLVRQCDEAGTACFVKQLGSKPVCQSDLDTAAFRATMHSKKGGALKEFPADLRVREFPR